MATDTTAIGGELRAFGAPQGSVVSLEGAPRPEHVPYLDLLRHDTVDRPEAVVEMQGRPVLFVARSKPGIRLPQLRRAIALRADGSFLGVVEPGRLTVYAPSLRSADSTPVFSVAAAEARAPDAIPELAVAPPSAAEVEDVHALLFRLFEGATKRLTTTGLAAQDALSLVGRAVFLRFLVDRDVALPADLAEVCPGVARFEDCFTSPANLAKTSQWLDDTFNGDLLPLSEAVRDGKRYLVELNDDARDEVCSVLTTIMHRAEASGQLRLDWSSLNFAHIPVGLLSQVYERHAGMNEPHAKASSVYYTPRTIAEYMIDEAFSALPKPHLAHVLDPAAGAGVFLVAAFRRLVSERWRADGKRPSTVTIRKILNSQLVGFEINESALRLCALSLYLTALEVDGHPRPLHRLRFDNLRGKVLFQLAGSASPPYIPGSLGPEAGAEHNGKYDLVIGNPPWTPLRRDERGVVYRRTVRDSLLRVVRERLGEDRGRTFSIVDDDPDLAFVWRAMEWAKPAGQIAFALHGRLLFRQSGGGRAARADLFRAIRITGILDGAAVRQTEVWPRVTAPFCLLFARNERSEAADTFYFVSVELDERLNRHGRVRIDAKAAHTVRIDDVLREPFLLKALARGTQLDVAVLRKLHNVSGATLSSYWREHGLEKGLGFQTGRRAGTQRPADNLHGLPELSADLESYRVPVGSLPKFDRSTLLFARRRDLYRAPLVLIPQTPDPRRRAPRALLASEDVVFSRSYIGYSASGHSDAEFLARYLFVLLNSNVPVYVALLSSGQFGVERDVYLSEDIAHQPFVAPEALSDAQRAEALRLASLLEASTPDWEAVDRWAASVYHLSEWDREVIADTLQTAAPWSEARAYAQQHPQVSTVAAFASRLGRELQPFVAKAGVRNLAVKVASSDPTDPWQWLTLCAETCTAVDRHEAVASANDFGATQIFICRDGALDVGILAQNRYWTATRARQLAIDLLHGDALLRTVGQPS